jgi:glycosyltransferase involved in cell wall biosynthesis
LISIIIPTLDEEKIIEKTVRCFLEYKGDREVIVSDSGSADRTVEIAKKVADHVVEFELGQIKNIAAGRNAGTVGAKGDFFAFCDADTYLLDPNTFFEKVEEYFQKDEKLVALTVALRVLPEMETVMDRIVFTGLNFFHFLVNNVFPFGAAPGEFQMIRREAFKKVHGYDEHIVASEDYDIFRRLRKIGKTKFVGSLVIYHTGRRAHAIGWPKLLWSWERNFLSVLISRKSVSKKWKSIR